MNDSILPKKVLLKWRVNVPVGETVDRLETLVKTKGMMVLVRIDRTAAAKSVEP